VKSFLWCWLTGQHLDTKNIRVESAIVEGSEISIYYDPLICKLVTHGPVRWHAPPTPLDHVDEYLPLMLFLLALIAGSHTP
jgi:acetyl/propionyl-CoA carboxylase alpha subunit